MAPKKCASSLTGKLRVESLEWTGVNSVKGYRKKPLLILAIVKKNNHAPLTILIFPNSILCTGRFSRGGPCGIADRALGQASGARGAFSPLSHGAVLVVEATLKPPLTSLVYLGNPLRVSTGLTAHSLTHVCTFELSGEGGGGREERERVAPLPA